MKKPLLAAVLVLTLALPAFSQVPTDGLLMPGQSLCTGFMYQHDQWKNYWEGSLKRDNQNIGKLTTSSVMWYGVYGVNTRLNIMAMVPYVSTKASKGTLAGFNGLQDVMLSAKYKLVEQPMGPGTFRTFITGTFTTPLSNYTPDILPLSIGLASTTGSARMNLNYTHKSDFYANFSGAYTWRSNVKLDRPAYYTDGTYFSTNLVDMPNMFDFKADVGYHKGPLQVEASYMQMITLGGGDIRRQDMPFVSNRMNASRVGALVMYYLPAPKNFAVRASYNVTVAGRNVGETTSLMGGIMYTIWFKKKNDAATTGN